MESKTYYNGKTRLSISYHWDDGEQVKDILRRDFGTYDEAFKEVEKAITDYNYQDDGYDVEEWNCIIEKGKDQEGNDVTPSDIFAQYVTSFKNGNYFLAYLTPILD